MAVEVKAMEVKKTQQVSKPIGNQTKDAALKAGHWKDSLGNIKEELSKINWTSPEELKTYTKIVVLATFLFGMGIYFMDIIIQTSLNVLEYLMKLIG